VETISRTLSSRESSGRGNSRCFAVTFDLLPSALWVSKPDPTTRDRSLVPFLDFSQNRFQVVSEKFRALTCVLNFNDIQDDRVGEVGLAV
jgi:hypothetical protein